MCILIPSSISINLLLKSNPPGIIQLVGFTLGRTPAISSNVPFNTAVFLRPNSSSAISLYTPIDKLKDNNAAIAYGKYRKEYDAIMKESIKNGFSPSSFKTSQQLVPVRQYLRKLATKLIIEHPEFGPLWNSILEPELREEVADEELLGF